MEPPTKRPRHSSADSDIDSSYIHTEFDGSFSEVANRFAGYGIQNSGGRLDVGRDVYIANFGDAAKKTEEEKALEELQKYEAKRKRLEQNRQAVIESLRFAQMDARHLSIKKAHARTCHWFLSDPKYLQWSKTDGTQHHEGFLWIKGKPGTGKSTLMKFLLNHMRERDKENTIVSFFFNARGNDMEKTTLGLYQSLLVQLFESCPTLRNILDQVQSRQEWGIEHLKELFQKAVDKFDKTSLICFIDALDEVQEWAIRDMISFLGELSDTRDRFRVCLASRHYPHITIIKAHTVVLENRREHHEDIVKYLNSALRIGDGKLAEKIHSNLQERASGVFMWVVLVVAILNKECDAGRKHRLQQRLREIPSDLHALFRDILTRDNYNTPGLLLCLQWVLFSTRPLSPRQLYYAILSRLEPESLPDCHTDEITDHDIAKFILDQSKGLAEPTKSEIPTIQFIHESVQDFLLKDNGLVAIWPGARTNLEGDSHDALKQSCFAYITCEPVVHHFASSSTSNKRTRNTPTRSDVGKKFPFLEYAHECVLHHANQAESRNISQAEFLASFPLTEWALQQNVFEKHEARKCTPTASLLYALALGGFGDLIRARPINRSCFHVEIENYGTPLFAALASRNTDAANAMLQGQARWKMPNASLSIPDLSISADDACFDFFGPDFEYDEDKNPISYLAAAGDPRLMRAFFALESIDVNERDRSGNVPLSYVTDRGYLVAEDLFGQEANVNATNSDGSTPLSIASTNGFANLVKALVKRGANVDLKDIYRRTALSRASENGHVEVVKLLVEKVSKVDEEPSHVQTPLSWASEQGHLEVVQLLLDRGADVDAFHFGATAHYRASRNGHTEVATFLAERGAFVED